MSLMDELERRRFLNTLRNDEEFRSTVRREILTEELLNLPQTVATLVDVVAQQRHDFTALATDVLGYMERTITLIGDGFAAVRSEIYELRTEMGELRTEMGELRTDMDTGFAAVRAELDQVHAEIRAIRDQLAS